MEDYYGTFISGVADEMTISQIGADNALSAIRQLAEEWRFVPGPTRPTEEDAIKERISQLLLQVLGKP